MTISVSTPRGDLSLTAKSEPVELLCHLNPNHTYYSQQVRRCQYCRHLFTNYKSWLVGSIRK